jgi:hypothetical protein
MKTPIIIAIGCLVTALAHAQGTVSFVNSTTTKVTYPTVVGDFSPIPVGNPNPNFVAGLFWGPEGSSWESLTLIATTQTWQPFSGVFSGGTVIFPVPGGTRVTVQVRAWNVATPDIGGLGPLQLITLGGAGTPPGAPASLTAPITAGDTSFVGFAIIYNPIIPNVPEPSSIALGFLGLGAVALFRRRK